MRLDDQRESDNVEDRRSGGGGFGGGGGGFGRGGMPVLIGGGGLGTVAIIVVALLLGVDPSFLFQGGDPGQAPQQQQSYPQGKPAPAPAGGQHGGGDDDAQRRFVSRVLATTEDAWAGLFQQQGRQYEQPRLVLFSGGTQGGCGMAQSAMGPFYCPRDH